MTEGDNNDLDNNDQDSQLASNNSTELTENDFRDGINEKLADLEAKYDTWKSGLIDQFLLNEDVYIYDFANGNHVCYILNEEPCCIPHDEALKRPRIPLLEKTWEIAQNKGYEKINCRNDFGLLHDGKNHCFVTNYPGVTCEEQFRDVCIYDKNGVACCTKKLDLINSWLDSGWVEEYGGPFENWVEFLNEHEDRGYWEWVYNMRWAVEGEYIYHVAPAAQGGGKKTRYNFECPTHHPVPTVAIILGCFIPVMIILIAIIGIMWFRGRNGQQNGKEEQTALDEIPPAQKL